MKNVSILEWNIHQQGGMGEGIIPSWVKDEVNGFDIVVLTEFCGICEGRNKFIVSLEGLGYHCVSSENPKGYRGCRNDILIAVKSNFAIQLCSWVPCYGVNNTDSIPENLRVDINCGGKVLTILGVRIKTLGNFKMRKQQLQWILNQIVDIKHPILIAGDFNHGKRGSCNLDWNKSIMEDMLKSTGFALYTPEGSSIYMVKNYRRYEFPEDHFITKGLEIDLQPYDRDFTQRDSGAYRWGSDFCEPWFPGKKQESVEPPFPDHAILKGTLFF